MQSCCVGLFHLTCKIISVLSLERSKHYNLSSWLPQWLHLFCFYWSLKWAFVKRIQNYHFHCTFWRKQNRCPRWLQNEPHYREKTSQVNWYLHDMCQPSWTYKPAVTLSRAGSTLNLNLFICDLEKLTPPPVRQQVMSEVVGEGTVLRPIQLLTVWNPDPMCSILLGETLKIEFLVINVLY